MTFGRLAIRSLLYHWRGNFAVLLGVVVGTAVLTGRSWSATPCAAACASRRFNNWDGWSTPWSPDDFSDRRSPITSMLLESARRFCFKAQSVQAKSPDGPSRRAGRVTVIGVDEPVLAGKPGGLLRPRYARRRRNCERAGSGNQ